MVACTTGAPWKIISSFLTCEQTLYRGIIYSDGGEITIDYPTGAIRHRGMMDSFANKEASHPFVSSLTFEYPVSAVFYCLFSSFDFHVGSS